LPSDVIIDFLFKEFDEYADIPINSYFESGGYERINAIRNLDSTFVYALLNMGIFMVTLIVIVGRRLFSKNEKVVKIKANDNKKVKVSKFVQIIS
jgi:hypothetical protein